jgi:glycosyltransferase involved in cell wall biosynthesis
MGEPLLSIVTTSYNRAQYLGSTIESVLAQEYAEFEYIIVEDCSPDDSLAVARSYEHDPRLRVVANPSNLGDYGNRNRGLRLARGKYVKFVDCDDLLYPHCVGSMLAVAEAFPDAGVVFATRERPPWRYPVRLSPEQVYRLHFTAGGVLHQGPLSSLLRREAVLAVGGFPELYTGDVACWLNLAREYPVVLMGGGLYWWREHAGQLSETLRSVSVKWASHQAEGARLHWEALGHPECPLPAEERALYQQEIERDYRRMVIRNGLRGRWRVVDELRRSSPFGSRAAATGVNQAPWAVTGSQPVPGPRVPPRTVRRSAAGLNGGSGPPPAISVLVPVTDGTAMIEETIVSILNQDHEDWEMIIVNDASLDNSAEIASRFSDGQRVRVIRNPTGVGKWAAHNACVRLARGRHLKIVEAGDTLEPHALRRFAWYAARFPEAGMVISCADERFLMPQDLSPEEVYQAEVMGLVSVMESPSGVLYRHDAVVRAGGFDPACPEAAAKLHLGLGRTAGAVFIYGGLVTYARGSSALRISSTRGAGRSEGEAAVLRAALVDTGCPLAENDRLAALKSMVRGQRRLALARQWGRSAAVRRLGRLLYPDFPPFAVAAKLAGGEASFERSRYPGGDGPGNAQDVARPVMTESRCP